MKNRVAYFGVFTALALIFSYVETLIPINFGIPGVKLGLANLVIVIALYKMKLTEVYLLSVVRVLLSGFIFGNYFSIIYSLAGGLLSLEEEQRIQCDGNQCGGRSVPQCGTADRCNACGGDIQCRLLFPGASGRRTDHRTGDRDRVGGNVEEN
mgnify:CR=1 FL=1